MGQGWSLSTRRQVPRVWRWKHGLGEKRPQVPFYFLVPNQERKQQPQINTQMIHKQDNTLSTLLSLRCAKPHKCKRTSSRTRHKSYEIPLSDRAPQIQSKLAYAEQEASAEGKGAPRCTRWGDVPYFQLMPLGSQKHSKQMGQVPQSWLCSTEVPRHRWLCPRGGKPGWRKYSGLRTWERLTPETKPTADRSPKVLTAPEPCAEGGQHLPGTSPQVPKQNGRGSCSGLHGGNASRGRPTVGTVSWHARQTGTGPKSVCPMLGKAKTQNIRVWIKERFTDRKGTNWDGRPNLQIRFKKMQSSGFFYVGEGGEGKGCFL